MKALYGLKSATKQWADHLATVLTDKLNFTRSRTDSRLYYNSKLMIWILVYVDDLFIVSATEKQIELLFEKLGE